MSLSHGSKTPGSLTAASRWELVNPTPAAPLPLSRETGDARTAVAAGKYLPSRPRPAPAGSPRVTPRCHCATRLFPIHPIPLRSALLPAARQVGGQSTLGCAGAPRGCPRDILRERGGNGTRRGNSSSPPQRRGLRGVGGASRAAGVGSVEQLVKGLRSEV